MSYTPGPWRWEVNMKGKSIQLCGGHPLFDLTVMDFVRWGMAGAKPRVMAEDGSQLFLHDAEQFRKPIEGREHHASWFQGINHPDMNLIAAAPEMYEALKDILNADAIGYSELIEAALKAARAAIAKAEGKE